MVKLSNLIILFTIILHVLLPMKSEGRSNGLRIRRKSIKSTHRRIRRSVKVPANDITDEAPPVERTDDTPVIHQPIYEANKPASETVELRKRSDESPRDIFNERSEESEPAHHVADSEL